MKIYKNYWIYVINIVKNGLLNLTYQNSTKFDNACLQLGGLQLPFANSFKYLGLEFTRDLNMSKLFLDKFSRVHKSFFSLNAFGFKTGWVSPFLQSYIYKTFCISRILYGLEIMHLNKKSINMINQKYNCAIYDWFE